MDVKRFNEMVSFRVLDFLPRGEAPWQRRLWSVGSILTLKEVLEGSEAFRNGVFSKHTFASLRHGAARQVGEDVGLGPPEQRTMLATLLNSELAFEGADYMALRELTELLRIHYLSNWITVLGSHTTPRASIERTARLLGSHLLDSGFSPQFLNDWLGPRLKSRPNRERLFDVLQEAGTLLESPASVFEILIVFENAPGRKQEPMPPEWRRAPEIAQWLRQNKHTTSGLRIAAGLLLSIEARDVWGALERAIENVERIRARVPIGTSQHIRISEHLWVKGDLRVFPIERARRGVMIKALDRAHQLYVLPRNSAVENALELIQVLDTGPPGPAVGTGWAALESLLVGPGYGSIRAIAAERVADIVASAFPRAELTTLSYACLDKGDALSRALSSAPDNHERARVLANALAAGYPFDWGRASDLLAYERIKKVLAAPKQVLLDVRRYVCDSIVRLYRQRNLILHWGRVDAVCLDACLRTAAPLIGAAFDRIVHGYLVQQLPPLNLAAHARLSLQLVGTVSGGHIVDLLN